MYYKNEKYLNLRQTMYINMLKSLLYLLELAKYIKNQKLIMITWQRWYLSTEKVQPNVFDVSSPGSSFLSTLALSQYRRIHCFLEHR